MNLLYFFRDINFHAIIVEKQLIKHDILKHCLTPIFTICPNTTNSRRCGEV